MITLLRYLIILVMSALLVVAGINYKYFICGPDDEYCASGTMPYASGGQSNRALFPSSGSGGGKTPHR